MRSAVDPSSHTRWQRGQRLLVRGDVWHVADRSAFRDCEALRLRSGRGIGPTRTILLPFDRPRPLPEAAGIRVLRRRQWLRRIRALWTGAQPAGGLSAIARCNVSLLPYQLEPALLMRRDGVARVMIADAVGLGKTIQAGLIVAELSAEHHDLRALIVVPAGLRDQWANELAARFGLDTIEASSAWLARMASELPPVVNPWSLPGIYIASMDLIKRAELLRPLEDVTWDAVIVDEAHDANVGTARRAAIHAIACRARRVVLLTATPHSGDPRQFASLCDVGAHDTRAPRIVMFRRSRTDVAPHTHHGQRRTRLFDVRLGPAERHMHALLENYTSRLCQESAARGDAPARLLAVVLRKRALSSASSLAASCRRRLRLLERPAEIVDPHQLMLPLGDEDAVADEEPDVLLGVRGLMDVARERRLLEAIGHAAERAGTNESKIRFLKRFLRRIHQPAILFTEYRDTLERLRGQLLPFHGDLQVLHGGMELRERAAATAAFNGHASLLLATDAASEGLNLHSRCRLVIHFELPWNPARLEQRAGRVDRIGQSRRVHEALLVADDTAEQLVLAPLVTKARRIQRSLADGKSVADALSESHVAAAVLEGTPIETPSREEQNQPFLDPPAMLRDEAIDEVERLMELRRRDVDDIAEHAAGPLIAISLPRRRTLRDGLVLVYDVALVAADGRVVHRELASAHVEIPDPPFCRTPASLRAALNRCRDLGEPRVRHWLNERLTPRLAALATRCARAASTAAEREHAIMRSLPSAATTLVQAGLFDQRALRTLSARQEMSSVHRAEAAFRLDAIDVASRVEQSLIWCAAILVGTRRS